MHIGTESPMTSHFQCDHDFFRKPVPTLFKIKMFSKKQDWQDCQSLARAEILSISNKNVIGTDCNWNTEG